MYFFLPNILHPSLITLSEVFKPIVGRKTLKNTKIYFRYMNVTEQTEKGIVILSSGLITIMIIWMFNFFFAPACSINRQYSVPFSVLFHLLGSSLAIAGIYMLVKENFGKTKFFSKKKELKVMRTKDHANKKR
jgi:hypothetical protein